MNRQTILDELSYNCNKLLYGKCTTVRCIKNSNQEIGKPYNIDLTTCEYYEAYKIIAKPILPIWDERNSDE